MDEEINVRSLYWQIDDLSDKLAAKTTEVNQLRQLLNLVNEYRRTRDVSMRKTMFKMAKELENA